MDEYIAAYRRFVAFGEGGTDPRMRRRLAEDRVILGVLMDRKAKADARAAQQTA